MIEEYIPVSNRTYGGYVLYAVGYSGNITCIEASFQNLPEASWFYSDLKDWMGSSHRVENGMIYLFLGSYCHTQPERFVGITHKIIPEQMIKVCRLWSAL